MSADIKHRTDNEPTNPRDNEKAVWMRRHQKSLAIGGLVVVVGGGAIGVKAASGSPHESRQTVGQTIDPTETTQPTSQTSQSTNSPSPTSIPTNPTETTSTNTATPSSEQSIDVSNLDPSTPQAISFVKGQKPTKSDVKVLLHNIEVAANTGDVNNLLYSGIYTDSELASSIQSNEMKHVQNEKQQAGALVHSFSMKLEDKDILLDSSSPETVHVRIAAGTDFDFAYTSSSKPLVTYVESTLELTDETITLPTGKSEHLLAISRMDNVPSSYQDWNQGYN